jgi:hypothetical protein
MNQEKKARLILIVPFFYLLLSGKIEKKNNEKYCKK